MRDKEEQRPMDDEARRFKKKYPKILKREQAEAKKKERYDKSLITDKQLVKLLLKKYGRFYRKALSVLYDNLVRTYGDYKFDKKQVKDIVDMLGYILGRYKKMGLDKDFVPSYNVIMNQDFILDGLSRLNKHDFKWMCNNVQKMLKDINNDPCVDNYRICKANKKGEMTCDYEEVREEFGCCGFYDKLFENEVTGNKFWLGCNYGH